MSEFIEPDELEETDYQRDLHLKRYIWASQMIKGNVVANASCSTNYGWEILKKPCRLVVGFDRNETALGIAVHKGRKWFIKMDFQDEDFDGFSTLVSLETIEHLERPFDFLKGLSLTIKELAISVPIIPTKHTNSWHLHDFTETEIKEKVTELGWTIKHDAYQEENGTRVYLLLYATR